MPCYLEENVNAQRGAGVFTASIRALRSLNALGYGMPDSGLSLDLVYNPQGPVLPPSQQSLESDYKKVLAEQHGVAFNKLLVLANMPVGRFGSTLLSRGELDAYLALLRAAHDDENLEQVMCRSLLSIDWQGYVYDCDFNQMLGLPMRINGTARVHLSELMGVDVEGRAIAVRAHCYACTAGQGSSCGGALN
jgi:radical SAM/Cys-rich protein